MLLQFFASLDFEVPKDAYRRGLDVNGPSAGRNRFGQVGMHREPAMT